MGMTSTDLLQALHKTGTPQATIEHGEKFVRLMKSDEPADLIEHFRQLRITEGTIQKALDLTSGRKQVKDFLGEPPPEVLNNESLARQIAEQTKRLVETMLEKQAEKQAEAQGQGIGNPNAQKPAVAGKR